MNSALLLKHSLEPLRLVCSCTTDDIATRMPNKMSVESEQVDVNMHEECAMRTLTRGVEQRDALRRLG